MVKLRETELLQDTLQDSRERWQDLIDQLPLSTVWLDRDFIIVDSNAQFRFEIGLEGCSSWRIDELLHPDDRASFIASLIGLQVNRGQLYRTILRVGANECFRLMIVSCRSSGRDEIIIQAIGFEGNRDLEVLAKPGQTSESEMSGIIEQIEDGNRAPKNTRHSAEVDRDFLAECREKSAGRKQQEPTGDSLHTVTRLSRRLELALDVSKIGVFEANFETGDVNWDDRMYDLFGAKDRETIRVNGFWENCLHPDDRWRVQENIRTHVSKLLPWNDEYRIIQPDGCQRFIRARTQPFIDEIGHRRMIGANWDVTDDRMLQLELQRARDEAETRNHELEIARSEIEHVAHHDYLTGLPNSRYLDRKIEELEKKPDKYPHHIGVLHIDLDRFKEINDRLGHHAGDAMLQHTARILGEFAVADNSAARVGGDEFVIISQPLNAPKELPILATGIISRINEPILFGEHTVSFGASIGICYRMAGRPDMSQMLFQADKALYKAKEMGRNRFVVLQVG